AEQAAFLDRACAGDAALRRRLDSLLWAHNEPVAFLERVARQLGEEADASSRPEAEAATPAPAEAPGGQLGPYRLAARRGGGGGGAGARATSRSRRSRSSAAWR